MIGKFTILWIILRSLPGPASAVIHPSQFFQRPDLKLARLRFYYGIKFEEFEEYPLNQAIVIFHHPLYNPNIKTLIFAHGYRETADSKSVQTIVEAYITRNDHNIIVLDWAAMSTGRYFFSALPNTKRVGKVLGNMLTKLYYTGVNIKSFHLVGFSLGAHLCGTVGRTLMYNTNGTAKISRITGLDPGFPGYYLKPFPRHISSEDADFVDIIHTDGSLAGAPVSTGTVDFWPNGGKFIQPGCAPRKMQISDPCSHQRSWRYWAESVSRSANRQFLAVKAKSWFHFIFGHFTEPRQYAIMGINTPVDVSGNYYLETNGKSPFARGKRGTYIQRQNYLAIISQFFFFQVT